MRQKRVKSYRKLMQLYRSSFQFREPYQLLVDAEFCQSIVKQKLDFQARLEDVCQGIVKPMITQCCMQVLYDLGPEGQDAVDLAKDFERRKCNHFKARPQDDCLLAMGGTDNKNRYVIATQSLELRKSLRAIPGLPIIYLARSVVLLETPSDQTLAKKAQMENQKLHVPKSELTQLAKSALPPSVGSNLIIGTLPLASSSALPTDEPSEPEVVPTKKRKIKGPKGPNPLSVKKKSTSANAMEVKPRAVKVKVGEGEEKGEKKGKGKLNGKEFGETKEVEREKKRPRVDDAEGKVVTLASRDLVREGAAIKKRKRSRGKKEGGVAAAEGEKGPSESGVAGGEDAGVTQAA